MIPNDEFVCVCVCVCVCVFLRVFLLIKLNDLI